LVYDLKGGEVAGKKTQQEMDRQSGRKNKLKQGLSQKTRESPFLFFDIKIVPN